jgi:hypothetical protein
MKIEVKKIRKNGNENRKISRQRGIFLIGCYYQSFLVNVNTSAIKII